MLHWRAKLLGLMLLVCGLATGCKHQLFVSEKTLQGLGERLPLEVESGDPRDSITPTLMTAPTPPDVFRPDRPARYISLEEVFAIGLENGTTNSRAAGGPNAGTIDDTLAFIQRNQFGGQFTADPETVRILALEPARLYSNLETVLARYDAQFVSSMQWNTTDSLQQGFQSFQNGSSAAFTSAFVKALPTGGFANLGFITDYRLLSSPPTGNFGVTNPSYTSRLIFGVEQPLWRDFGVDINQMLGRHPVSGATTPLSNLLNSANGAFNGRQAGLSQNNEGILVARIRYNQGKAEFERQINAMVLNLEVAYWNLYAAYGELYANEEVLRIAHKSWMINKAKFEAGAKGPGDYYPFEAQYHEFRGNRLDALAKVIEAERNLRGLMGLPIEDGKRLVPVTPPSLAKYSPNFEAAINDSLTYRPELTLAREQLRTAQIALRLAMNQLKPDLNASAQYSPVGFGTRLDGHGSFKDGNGEERPSNALRSLASDHFNDWSIGLVLNIPIGYRAEMALVRRERLHVAQQFGMVKDQEERAMRFVTKEYQALASSYGSIETRRAERKSYAEAVEARFKEVAAGKTTQDQFLLDMQRRFAIALVNEYKAIASYNISLATFEWSKGTLLHHNNVYLSEGALPECAQVRAVEHEKERTKARVLHEKPRPLAAPGQFVEGQLEVTGEPHWDALTGRQAPHHGATTEPAPRAQPELLPAPPKKPRPDLEQTNQQTPPGPVGQIIEFSREPIDRPLLAPEIPMVLPAGSPMQTPMTESTLPSAVPGLSSIPASPFAPLPAIELPREREITPSDMPRIR